MRTKVLSLIVISTIILNGCGKVVDEFKEELDTARANKTKIAISFNEGLERVDRESNEWIELDQLKNREAIRETIDKEVGTVKFDRNSKNGILYVDSELNWTGNNTMYNAFMNKAFTEEKWFNSEFKNTIGEKASQEYSDIDNSKSGVIAAVNSYWNIIPDKENGESGLGSIMTRGEAMSAIARADTPVEFVDSTEFEKSVGKDKYSNTASLVEKDSYLRTEDGGLNYSTYNEAITRGELAYIIASRYYGFKGDEKGRAYNLEYYVQTEGIAPEDIGKAILELQSKGLIDENFNWMQPVQGGYLITMLIDTYVNLYRSKGLKLNAKLGGNVGVRSTDIEPENTDEETVDEISDVKIDKIKDVTNIDTLLATYGNEINMTEEELAEIRKNSEGWTFKKADKVMEVAFCNNLNVRTGPSTDYRIIKTVPAGTKAHIVAICKENGWYRIIADGKIVYQSGVYFK